MKIVVIVNDVDPAQAGELQDDIEDALYMGPGWLKDREYTLGVLDDNCQPIVGGQP